MEVASHSSGAGTEGLSRTDWQQADFGLVLIPRLFAGSGWTGFVVLWRRHQALQDLEVAGAGPDYPAVLIHAADM